MPCDPLSSDRSLSRALPPANASPQVIRAESDNLLNTSSGVQLEAASVTEVEGAAADTPSSQKPSPSLMQRLKQAFTNPATFGGLGSTAMSIPFSLTGTIIFAAATGVTILNSIGIDLFKKSAAQATDRAQDSASGRIPGTVSAELRGLKELAGRILRAPSAVLYAVAAGSLLSSLELSFLAKTPQHAQSLGFLFSTAGAVFMASLVNRYSNYELLERNSSNWLRSAADRLSQLPGTLKNILASPPLHFSVANGLFAWAAVGQAATTAQLAAFSSGIILSAASGLRSLWPAFRAQPDSNPPADSFLLAAGATAAMGVSSFLGGSTFAGLAFLAWATQHTLAYLKERGSKPMPRP